MSRFFDDLKFVFVSVNVEDIKFVIRCSCCCYLHFKIFDPYLKKLGILNVRDTKYQYTYLCIFLEIAPQHVLNRNFDFAGLPARHIECNG